MGPDGLAGKPGMTATSPVAPAAPPVENQIVRDMLSRGVPVLVALVILGAAIWGVDGGLSTAFASGLVAANFLFSAALLGWAARISLPLLMVAALGGFVLRLALITVAVLAVKDQSWVELVPLALTVIAAHLGLLVWETRHVSTSLAFPGVLPARPRPSFEGRAKP